MPLTIHKGQPPMTNESTNWLFLAPDRKTVLTLPDNDAPSGSTILASPGGHIEPDVVARHGLKRHVEPQAGLKVVPTDSAGFPLVVSQDGHSARAEAVLGPDGGRLRDPSLALPIPPDEVEVEEEDEETGRMKVRRIKKADHSAKVEAALKAARRSDPRKAQEEPRPPVAPPIGPATEKADTAAASAAPIVPEAKMVGPEKVENKAVPQPAADKK